MLSTDEAEKFIHEALKEELHDDPPTSHCRRASSCCWSAVSRGATRSLNCGRRRVISEARRAGKGGKDVYMISRELAVDYPCV